MRLQLWKPLETSRVNSWYIIIGDDVWSHEPHNKTLANTTIAGSYEHFDPAWESGARERVALEDAPRGVYCEMLRILSMYKLDGAYYGAEVAS